MPEKCPVPDCPNGRGVDKMMCPACWRRVTKPTQAAVYRAWRAYSRAAGRGAPAEEFRAAREAYYSIREQAIREADA